MPRDNGQPPGDAAPPAGDNTRSRYEIIKDKYARLEEIREEQKALTKERNDIIGELEKESGVNRGALAEIRRLGNLSATAIEAREESRNELFGLLIKPKLEEAAQGQSDE